MAYFAGRDDVLAIRTTGDAVDLVAMTVELLSLGPQSVLEQVLLHWGLWKRGREGGVT